MSNTIKTRDPMRTKTGKTRLGPLSFEQLNKLLEQTTRPKDRAKIQRRIWQLVDRKKLGATDITIAVDTSDTTQ